jgi:GNAT superfamily N-acetyltransferase
MGDTMNRVAVYGPTTLDEQPHIYDAALAAMKVVQAAGLIPKDRSKLSGDSLVVSIEDNGTAALAVFFECERNILWLDFIYVAPHHRRKGYGAALIRRIEAVAADNGIAKIMLGTHEQNEPMRRLGQACGYFTDHLVLTRALARPLGAANNGG